MKKKILAILPISIGGRLTTSSIIDGLVQNNFDVTVYDELFDKNLDEKKLKEEISLLIKEKYPKFDANITFDKAYTYM